MKKTCALLLALVIILTSSMAFAANEVDSNTIILDTFAMRPLGFVGLLMGCAIYTITLPVAALTRSHKTTYNVLIEDPFKFTFTRPVGEIDSIR